MRRHTFWLAFLIVLCTGSIASAHPQLMFHTHGSGFEAGVAHPFTGIDHLFAMVMVGVLAAQMGKRATWLVPSSFLACMVVGGLAGMAGMATQGTEAAIAISLVLLGLAMATEVNLSLGVMMAACGAFGFAHGYAHGTEMPAIAQPVLYGIGFVLATATLHLSGVLLQRFAARSVSRQLTLRLAGAAGMAMGLLLLVNMF
jgi:urease accessory protein